MNDQPKTFAEFTDAMCRALFDALLRGGSQELRSQLWIWLPYFIDWNKKVKEIKGK